MHDFRKGTLVKPYRRLDDAQLKLLHETSLRLLNEIGIECYNAEAADILDKAGCRVMKKGEACWQIYYPAKLVNEALETAPAEVILGARNPENALHLNAEVPRVYFGTGSETNIYLETERINGELSFVETRGNLEKLCRSARLCNQLPNVDFFIRNVNLQDEEITVENKDVNVFFASLLYMSKHVQAGLVNLEKLDDILKMAEIVAGGKEEMRKQPPVSFITCVIKSPLQMVDDTTSKLIAITKRGMPVVLSACPQGGSTGPIQEEGMVAMINAETLAVITLAQTVNPGTPVLYGAVPVRARLDNLHDLYGAPEFVHYNHDCIQLARHYKIPCYTTAGVADAKVPGMQATVEKVYSQLQVASAGGQYIHYAFGLLDKTNIFCPLQAVLDDANIGMVRDTVRMPRFGAEEIEEVIDQISKVMDSSTRIFSRFIRRSMRRKVVSSPYPFETHSAEDKVLPLAYERLKELEANPGDRLEDSKINDIYGQIPGLLEFKKFQSGKTTVTT